MREKINKYNYLLLNIKIIICRKLSFIAIKKSFFEKLNELRYKFFKKLKRYKGLFVKYYQFKQYFLENKKYFKEEFFESIYNLIYK